MANFDEEDSIENFIKRQLEDGDKSPFTSLSKRSVEKTTTPSAKQPVLTHPVQTLNQVNKRQQKKQYSEINEEIKKSTEPVRQQIVKQKRQEEEKTFQQTIPPNGQNVVLDNSDIIADGNSEDDCEDIFKDALQEERLKKADQKKKQQPALLPNSIEIENEQNPTAKKSPEDGKQLKKKKEQMWKKINPKKINIITISQPRKNTNAVFKNIKYQLQFQYELYDQPGKIHTKTVRLGNVKDRDMIDNQESNGNNKIEMFGRLSKLKYYYHPLHPHFWTFNLLNAGGATIEENYLNLIKKYKLLY